MSQPRRAIESDAFVAPVSASAPRRGVKKVTLIERARPMLMPLGAAAAMSALVFGAFAANPSGSAVAVGVPAAQVSTADAEFYSATLSDSVERSMPDADSNVLAEEAVELLDARALTALNVQKSVAAKVAADQAAAAKAAAAKAAAEKAAKAKAALIKASASGNGGTSNLGAAGKYGLRGGAIKTYNAVMSRFSGINSVGGYRPSSLSNHQQGLAIDFMITPGRESALGWSIAKYLAANAGALNIDHIIFEQRIWTPSSRTWRMMEDRGGTTANHYDHVHVSMNS